MPRYVPVMAHQTVWKHGNAISDGRLERYFLFPLFLLLLLLLSYFSIFGVILFILPLPHSHFFSLAFLLYIYVRILCIPRIHHLTWKLDIQSSLSTSTHSDFGPCDATQGSEHVILAYSSLHIFFFTRRFFFTFSFSILSYMLSVFPCHFLG